MEMTEFEALQGLNAFTDVCILPSAASQTFLQTLFRHLCFEFLVLRSPLFQMNEGEDDHVDQLLCGLAEKLERRRAGLASTEKPGMFTVKLGD